MPIKNIKKKEIKRELLNPIKINKDSKDSSSTKEGSPNNFNSNKANNNPKTSKKTPRAWKLWWNKIANR